MNKKGLTLVELISVLAILALLSVIIFPLITNNIKESKDNTKEMQMASIKEAATKYVADNIGNNIFMNENEEVVTLQTLIDEGYLNGKYKNPETGKQYNLLTSKVTITKNNNSYEYNVELLTE